ncbi:MAG: DUF1353 domain-containing protein [Desulfobacterales bacterium]|nr:DUF1353 domain-containing protein [Desulfobacterales bacterium]
MTTLSTYKPFHPDVMAAALVHDWLFLTHQVDRTTADQIFYDRLILNGANPIEAKIMHKAVRVGAGMFWKLKPEKIEVLKMLYVLVKDSPRFGEYCLPRMQLKRAWQLNTQVAPSLLIRRLTHLTPYLTKALWKH